MQRGGGKARRSYYWTRTLVQTLVWDATYVDTLSYLLETIQRADVTVLQTLMCNRHRYSTLAANHIFIAFATERPP